MAAIKEQIRQIISENKIDSVADDYHFAYKIFLQKMPHISRLS